MRRRDGLAQDIAQLHQSLARLAAAALARWRQGEHLRQANLMSDQITGQQLIAGLNQGWQASSAAEVASVPSL